MTFLPASSSRIAALWHRVVRFGFRLLYNELAWLYDPVSQIVSRGRWHAWQQCALPYLPQSGRVLEVGCGPGHLADMLGKVGYETVAVDLSRRMLRLAKRKQREVATPVTLCRGRAQELPFTSQSFDAVVITFPTPDIFARATLCELERVLDSGRKLVIVLDASLTKRDTRAWCVGGLYRLAGLCRQNPGIFEHLEASGFLARSDILARPGSRVTIMIGTRRS